MNIEELRELCLSLDGVTEDVKWGADLCFCIGEKMFCVTGMNSPEFGATFKASDEDFDELIGRPGISPAKYLARYKWVSVMGEGTLSRQEWQHYVSLSYKSVFQKLPARLRSSIEAQAK